MELDKLELSTIFFWEKFGKNPEHEYSRISNPTRNKLEKELRELEKGKEAFAVNSGQAASLLLFSLLKKGEHVICSGDVYEGTLRLLNIIQRFGIEVSIIPPSKLESGKSIKKNTKLIFLENPSCPLFNEFNIRKIKETAGKNILIAVDNTIATPIFQNPLNSGADIVIHSLTKFISGNNNSTGGVLITNRKELTEELRNLQRNLGIALSPFDCFLSLRGLRTLEQRMKKHTENSKRIIEFLKTQDKIEKVNFPGFGGVLSFNLKENKISAEKLFNRLKRIRIAQSYGGPVTTIHHPETMLPSSLNKELKEKIGLDNNLVRLAVGLENSDEIIKDLENGLK